MAAHSRHVLILGVAKTLTNFRGDLIRTMLAAGHRVTAVNDVYDADVATTLASWGVDFHVVPMWRAGMNPFADASTLVALTKLMRDVKPDVYFGYTVKASTLGVIAARMADVPRRVAMVVGLGYAFGERGGAGRAVARIAATQLYRRALPLADKVIFQNPDDLAYFVDSGLVSAGKAARVEGSGVDLDHFAVADLPDGPPTFLMLARLLRDKGVREYAEAARMVKRLRPEARFVLAGDTDANPASIARGEVLRWAAEGTLEWHGHVDEVRETIAGSHVGVLPSYHREGIPRASLEMLSVGRALITTDAPGCRETVIDGVNGLLVPPRDPEALAAAILRLIDEPALVARFGAASRRLAETRFDVVSVNARMMEFLGLDATARPVPWRARSRVPAMGAVT
jgi:glycosyltransferase involved in cell wall biosynthesis